MKDSRTDPVVEEPLTGEPIHKSILDKANGDPVAEAERALEDGLKAACRACQLEQELGMDGNEAYEIGVSIPRHSCESNSALARRYAALRALAALKYIERAADCDCSVCAAYLFVCEALEKELADAR